MEIWIKKDEKNVIRLPVNPPEYEVSREANNTEVTRYGKGPAVLMGNTGLQAISFSSFFPNQAYPFNQYQESYQLSNGATVSLGTPEGFISLIEAWRDGPVTLIITGYINGLYTIESFSNKGPDACGDIDYSISFKKYEKPTYTAPAVQTASSNKVNSKSGSKGNKTSRQTKSTKTTKYTVKKGDTLSGIAKKITGNSSNWKAIYTQNKKVIEQEAKKRRGKNKTSENGHWIYPGTKLVIKI